MEFFNNLVNDTRATADTLDDNMVLTFINSLKVKCVNTKSTGGVLTLCFNVLADGHY